MLTETMKEMVRAEQQRQRGGFVDNADLDAYFAKLDAHAEVVDEITAGRCRGFVAFYCNNFQSRRAFITLVLVSPQDRGSGVGRELVSRVLDICRERGFVSCGLEVRSDNTAALALYSSLGFASAGERDGKQVLECPL